MLDWYEPLYIGKHVEKKLEKYRQKLNKGKLTPNIYLITFPVGQADQLEIINSFYLLQNALYRRCPKIVGIAKGYDEACELVLQIVEETILHTGTANIKEYLMQR